MEDQLTEFAMLVFVAIKTTFLWNKNVSKSCFAHCIYDPNLIFTAFIILELFTILV